MSDTTERMLQGLDEAQREAVLHPAPPLRIIAGAGAGKTRVLTRRIAYQSAVDAIDPRRVLALTFTRKAAGELNSRLRGLGLRDSVAAGTFHGIAYAQLRRYWADNNRTAPGLLDRKAALVARVLPPRTRRHRGARRDQRDRMGQGARRQPRRVRSRGCARQTAGRSRVARAHGRGLPSLRTREEGSTRRRLRRSVVVVPARYSRPTPSSVRRNGGVSVICSSTSSKTSTPRSSRCSKRGWVLRPICV